MQAVEALTRLGGIAGAQELLRLTSRRKLRRAVRRGEVEHVVRGRYALPTASEPAYVRWVLEHVRRVGLPELAAGSVRSA